MSAIQIIIINPGSDSRPNYTAMADIALKDAPVLSSLKITDRVTIMAADTGHQIASMTVGEFVKQMVELIPAATASSNGLMSPSAWAQVYNLTLSTGVSGGGVPTWYKCLTLQGAFYNMGIVELVIGTWVNLDKTDIKVAFNNPAGTTDPAVQVLRYNGDHTSCIGYRKSTDNTLEVWVGAAPGQSIVANVFAEMWDKLQGGAGFPSSSTEPEGIIYINKP